MRTSPPQPTSSTPRRLTQTERGIIAYVSEHEGEPCSKAQIAEALGRNRKTIDRLVSKLREEGLLVSEASWGKNGAQLANTYRLARIKWRELPSAP